MDKKFFVFNVNAFELIAANFPLFWLEYLASAVNGLTKGANISV